MANNESRLVQNSGRKYTIEQIKHEVTRLKELYSQFPNDKYLKRQVQIWEHKLTRALP